MSCFRHFQLGLRSHASGSSGDAQRRPFVLPGTPRRFARDRAVDVRHVVLELDVDFVDERLSGTATHVVRALRPDVRRLTLDAVELDVSAVTLDGKPVEFRNDGRHLAVELGRPVSESRDSRLAITYSCSPRRGFYFVGPDDAHSERVVHGWSQGQDEDSRHWWPAHDYPNEKATTEVIATVPAEFVAISNGTLVGSKRHGKRRTFHYRQEVPHVAYLVTLAVGPFERLRQQVGDLALTTWHLPGRAEEAMRCVADTPRMLQLFGELTGVPYPFAKYDQVFVSGFIFGGMENTSATTLTDTVLHDERAALDYTAEDLVSHELAHQWWGDLVTCRDWSQAWLNEGFATYFEVVWKEHAKGADEAWMLRRELEEAYLKEDGKSYRRPVVCRSYDEPIELFDAHLYQKGAWVLGMLRHELGDVLFWRALGDYLRSHREGLVETSDLRRAVEGATGRNFERFFEQWVESAGYPELSITGSWDSERMEYSIDVEQKQEGSDTPQAFRLDLDVALLVENGWRRERVALERRRQSFVFSLPEEPAGVALDPEDHVLAAVTWERPPAQLVTVLERAPWAPARAEAAEALGKGGSRRAVEALARALSRDGFWGVRAAAATALGEAKTVPALEALLAAASRVDHPKARRAWVAALGSHRSPAAFEALAEIVRKGDPSYFVEAEAATALGATRQPGALEVLSRALKRKATSWNEIVRCGVMDGLGRLGYERRKDVVDLLLPWTERGRHFRCRQWAVRNLARVGSHDERVRERLEELLDDSEFRVVLEATEGLGDAGSRKSRPALSRIAEVSLDGRVKRSARESLRQLDEGPGPALAKLEADLQETADEGRRLRERLDRVELRFAQVHSPVPGPAPIPAAPPPARRGSRSRSKPRSKGSR